MKGLQNAKSFFWQPMEDQMLIKCFKPFWTWLWVIFKHAIKNDNEMSWDILKTSSHTHDVSALKNVQKQFSHIFSNSKVLKIYKTCLSSFLMHLQHACPKMSFDTLIKNFYISAPQRPKQFYNILWTFVFLHALHGLNIFLTFFYSICGFGHSRGYGTLQR